MQIKLILDNQHHSNKHYTILLQFCQEGCIISLDNVRRTNQDYPKAKKGGDFMKFLLSGKGGTLNGKKAYGHRS
jgi:hypothetical protein